METFCLVLANLLFILQVVQSNAHNEYTNGGCVIDNRGRYLYAKYVGAGIILNRADIDLAVTIVVGLNPFLLIALPVIAGNRVGGYVSTLIVS